jgi:3-oxoacyl-[acyl-carrier protein] reductase
MRLSGKVALVTGGSRGIGRSVAECFVREGARVFIVGRNDRRALDDALAGLRELGAEVDGELCDVGQHQRVRQLADRIERRFGRLDVLVNNAGVISPRPLLEIPPQDWESMLRNNLLGTIFCTIEMTARFFKPQRAGKIVNVTSSAARRPTIGLSDYATAKGGIEAFTLSAAKELLADNIQVNAIAPVGFTRMVEALIDSARKAAAAPEMISSLEALPGPERLVRSFLFFASSDSDYVTGQILTSDGGFLL